MIKLIKLINQYKKDMRLKVYELESQDKTRYHTLGVYKLIEKYGAHMLLIKNINGIERRLSIAYRDILTEDVKIDIIIN